MNLTFTHQAFARHLTFVSLYNCNVIRVRQGLELRMPFVVFMDEGGCTCWLRSCGPNATSGMYGWAAEWLVGASSFTTQMHL